MKIKLQMAERKSPFFKFSEGPFQEGDPRSVNKAQTTDPSNGCWLNLRLLQNYIIPKTTRQWNKIIETASFTLNREIILGRISEYYEIIVWGH